MILKNVRLLRRQHNESTFHELLSIPVVNRFDALIDYILSPPLETVLAHHDRPPLPVVNTLRNEKRSIREYVGPQVESEFVPIPTVPLVCEPGSRVRGNRRFWKLADNIDPKLISENFP